MDISLTGSGIILPLVIIGIVVIAIIAVVMIKARSKKQRAPKRDVGQSPDSSSHRLDYRPALKPIPAIHPPVPAAPRARIPEVPRQKEIDLTSSYGTMTESLQALVEKYSLQSFSIATADGLLFGSSGGDSAATDAATCSEIFKNKPLVATPGVFLFGLTHKSSDLIGIVRTESALPLEILKQIETDTKVILNWWV